MRLIRGSFRWLILDIGRWLTVLFCKHLKVRNRILFYSERSQDKLMDNLYSVYSVIDAPKVVCANKLPHAALKKPYIYYLLYTSKIIVSDDYIRYLRVIKMKDTQKVVQLWHGGGMLKKICLDAPLRMPYDEERSAHSQYTALITSSEGCVPVYAKAFGVDEGIVLPYGMPRTDKLLNADAREELKSEFYEKHPELKGKRIISYFPTFREENLKRIRFDPKLDFSVLEKCLKDDEVFIIHRHPVVDYKIIDKDTDKIIDLTECPSLQLYCVSSLVVTDYSSVVFDACLIDVPFVFYCPDRDSYDRELYINPETDLPGELTENQEDMMIAMRRALDNPDIERVRSFSKYHMGACDGNSSKRVAELILKFYQS